MEAEVAIIPLIVVILIVGVSLAWPQTDSDGGGERGPEARPQAVPPAAPSLVVPIPVALPTEPFQARARIIDGDTIEVRPADGGPSLRVRLQDMDAPEFDQAEGPAAADMLARVLRWGACTVEPRGPDVYGRLVARVWREDGKDVGLCMIAAGLAIAVGQAPPVYRKVEAQAREERRGAWGRGGFEEPAVWRRAKA